MKMLRDSMHNLWSEILFLILETKYGINPDKGASKEQIDSVGKEVWKLLTLCSEKEDLPDKSGTAFWLGWGRCNITKEEVANILTEQFRKEGKPISLNKKNITKYYNFTRTKIKDRVLSRLEISS